MINAIFVLFISVISRVQQTSAQGLSSPEAGAWQISSQFETIPPKNHGSGNTRSIITFSQNSSRIIYRPESAPYGLVSSEKIVLNKTTYFLTAWAFGAATIMIKVFDPAGSQANPLCELISEGENSQLRIQGSRLQVLINSSDQKEPSWESCKSL